MARIRSIKPEFFRSLSIAELTFAARLTFIGLWTHADDDGRCLDDARLIKADIWPLDDAVTIEVVGELLDELHRRERIIRYRAGRRDVLQVVGWEHQKIDRRKASVFPPHDAPDVQVRPPVEPSTIDRRSVVDPSSPDLDLDLDHGSGSLAPAVAAIDTSSSTPEGRPPGGGKRRDLLWEAVLEVCGVDATRITPSARGAYNRAVGDLRSIGAEPLEVGGRAAAYRRVYPGTALTPTALAKHWPQLDPAVVDMPDVGTRGGRNAAVLDAKRAELANGRPR